jgi:hypothetical protein
MSTLSKQAIMGASDPRALLLQAGVQGMRLQCGYVAPVLTEDDGLPMLQFAQRDLRYAWVSHDYNDHHYQQYVGEMMVIWCQSRLCYPCAENLERLYYPHARIYTMLDDGEICECCGNIKKDDIPF